MSIRSLLAASVALAVLSACSTTHNEANCPDPKPGTIVSVNDYCAIMPEDPVDPTITREWNGQKIGFCCQGCLKDWDAMTDVQKSDAVKTAVAKGKVSG